MINLEDIYLGAVPNDDTGDTLRFGGDIINDNFDKVEQHLNNKVRFIYTMTAGNDPMQKIVYRINNTGLTVDDDEIIIASCFKVYTNGLDNFTAKTYSYIWLKGKGIFGTVNSNTVDKTSIGLISVRNIKDNNVYDLGEIGTTPIEDAVNNSGPYQVNNGAMTVFTITRSGTPEKYLYIGSVNGLIGLGEAQTNDLDY